MDALNVSVFEANTVSRVYWDKSLHADQEVSDKFIFSTPAQHWEDEYHKDICGYDLHLRFAYSKFLHEVTML